MTAAMQGEIFATTNRFRLGSFEVTAILDGAILRDSVKPPFCLDLGEDDIAALGAANRIPVDRFEHPSVYLPLPFGLLAVFALARRWLVAEK